MEGVPQETSGTGRCQVYLGNGEEPRLVDEVCLRSNDSSLGKAGWDLVLVKGWCLAGVSEQD